MPAIPPHPSTSTQNPTPNNTPKSPPTSHQTPLMSRVQRCGSCSGCKSSPCGKCPFCRDSPQFGGPGVKKQSCVLRRCYRVVERKLRRDYAALKPRSGCGRCAECTQPNCATCLICLDLQLFGGRPKYFPPGAQCVKKKCAHGAVLEPVQGVVEGQFVGDTAVFGKPPPKKRSLPPTTPRVPAFCTSTPSTSTVNVAPAGTPTRSGVPSRGLVSGTNGVSQAQTRVQGVQGQPPVQGVAFQIQHKLVPGFGQSRANSYPPPPYPAASGAGAKIDLRQCGAGAINYGVRPPQQQIDAVQLSPPAKRVAISADHVSSSCNTNTSCTLPSATYQQPLYYPQSASAQNQAQSQIYGVTCEQTYAPNYANGVGAMGMAPEAYWGQMGPDGANRFMAWQQQQMNATQLWQQANLAMGQDCYNYNPTGNTVPPSLSGKQNVILQPL